jgi:predicted PolB exonuclease-like 3'-5' exonuclease
MFTPNQLEKLVIFDIETAGQQASLDQLSDRLSDQWKKRAEYLRNHLSEKYPDNQEKSDSELFVAKSALQAEFGKVVCVSFGKMKFNEDEQPVFQIVTYSGEDEELLLKQAFTLIDKMARAGVKLAGHNIKRFDIPFLCKRAMINSLELPLALQVWDKKPWELPFVDTTELWSFGAWQEGFASLDLLTAVLGIDSPKDDISGDKVHEAFWNREVQRIAEYCQKDVTALAQVLLRLSGQNLIEAENIIVK